VAGATVLVIAVLAVAACSGGSLSTGGHSDRSLTIGALAPPRPWDLRDADLDSRSLQYEQPVYDTLVRLDPAADPTPSLATAWTWDGTRTVLSLTLRQGVRFTDGTALDAAAVKANLLNTKSGTGDAAAALRGVRQVDVVATDRVTVTLAAPDPSFLALLGQSPGMIESPGAIADGTARTKPVGSGPYLLSPAGTTEGSQYTYVRNPGYWNAGAFPFNTIVIKVLPDLTARENALRSGQIDAAEISPTHLSSFAGPGFRTSLTSSGDIEGFYLWDRDGRTCRPLGDVRVRQAINYAFDRATIARQLGAGMATPTEQVFNPDGPAFDESLNSTYSYDPAKAKLLLAQAGYPHGFACATPDFSALVPQAQAALTQYLSAVGITLQPQNIPLGQLLSSLQSGHIAMSYFRFNSGSPWDTAQSILARDAVYNPFQSGDPTVDRLVAQARGATGADQDRVLKQLNQYVVEQAWSAPWDVPKDVYITGSGVSVTQQRFSPAPPIYAFSPAG
jgi:peptide/nickel transport system substrate-binding protein